MIHPAIANCMPVKLLNESAQQKQAELQLQVNWHIMDLKWAMVAFKLT